jgi:hypothetical protein
VVAGFHDHNQVKEDEMEATLDRRMFLVMSGGAAVAVATVGTTGCSTSWIDTVIADIPVVVNIANSVVSVIAEATGNGSLPASVAAILTTAMNVAIASLNAFQDAANAYKANDSKGNLAALISALTKAQGDVQGVIAALPAGTVSPTVLAVIVAALGTAILTLSSIQALIPGAAPSEVTAKAMAAVVTGKVSAPNAATIKFSYNAVLAFHGYGHLQLQ